MATDNTPKNDEQNDTPGVADAVRTPDVQAAERSGVSEGEVKALRDEAGLDLLPGHEANVKQWEASEEGKAFVKDAKKNAKEAEEAAKAAHEDLDKDGKSEAVKKYEETAG